MSQKPKFISALAHDLKNSVGNSMMYAELLSMELQELAEANTQIGEEVTPLMLMSENIRLSSSKLINQINSWVYTHHFIAGSYEAELSTINIASFIDNIVESNHLYLAKKEIKLTKDWIEEIKLTVDEEILKLIVDNLLIQCIIFSNPGDEIRISIRQSDDGATIAIADTYGNSRPEVIPRFLNQGEKVTGDEIPEEGILKATGYGMIFCGLAIQAIGGRAHVEENDLGGTTFSIQLNK